MKNLLFFIFLLSVNFIYGQDTANNKAFPKFLNSGASKTFVDDNGIETIVSVVTGKIYLNNKVITLHYTSLMLFRHSIKDSMNYTYIFLSDTLSPFYYGTLSEICRVKNGIGFIVNIAYNPINLKFGLDTLSSKLSNKSVYMEFDSVLNLTGFAKFESNSYLDINKLCADDKGNKFSYASYAKEFGFNDTTLLPGNGKNKYCIFSFTVNKINWSYTFDTLNTQLVNLMQLATKNNKVYYYLYLNGKNIDFKGHLLSRTSTVSYCLLKLNSAGQYINEIETEYVNQAGTFSSSLLVSDKRIFLSMSYTDYIKFGNFVFTKPAGNSASLLCEMDSALVVKSMQTFSISIYTLTNTLKAYDETSGLLYFDILTSGSPTLAPVVINDTIKYFNNFIHYPNYSRAHTLFSYSTIKKVLISSYDFTLAYTEFIDAYFPKTPDPKVYFNSSFYGNIKLEGKTILNGSDYMNFSFALKKPSVLVAHPSGFRALRRQKDLAELVWVNGEIYDSLEIQKYSMLNRKIEYVFKVMKNPVDYMDTTPLLETGNYYYKIRGFKNGEYSIWIASDSTSTIDPLALERYLNGTLLNDSTVLLTWGLDSTRSNNFFYRELYRSENPTTGFQRITTIVPRTIRSYPDSSVSTGRTYYYFVRDFTGMYDNRTDTIMVKVGVNLDFFSNYFEVYPNPCFDKLFLNLSDKTSRTVTVIDACGRVLVLTLKEDNNNYFVDVSGLGNGMYTISCLQSGALYTKRFVKM